MPPARLALALGCIPLLVPLCCKQMNLRLYGVDLCPDFKEHVFNTRETRTRRQKRRRRVDETAQCPDCKNRIIQIRFSAALGCTADTGHKAPYARCHGVVRGTRVCQCWGSAPGGLGWANERLSAWSNFPRGVQSVARCLQAEHACGALRYFEHAIAGQTSLKPQMSS